VLIVFVVRVFIPYPETVKHGDKHADGKSGNINKGGDFVFGQTAPGGFEITLEHINSLRGEWVLPKPE
jgi:hypothetical protein